MNFEDLYLALDKQIGRLLNARDRIKHVGELSDILTEGSRRDALSGAVAEINGACDAIRELQVLDATPVKK